MERLVIAGLNAIGNRGTTSKESTSLENKERFTYRDLQVMQPVLERDFAGFPDGSVKRCFRGLPLGLLTFMDRAYCGRPMPLFCQPIGLLDATAGVEWHCKDSGICNSTSLGEIKPAESNVTPSLLGV